MNNVQNIIMWQKLDYKRIRKQLLYETTIYKLTRITMTFRRTKISISSSEVCKLKPVIEEVLL